MKPTIANKRLPLQSSSSRRKEALTLVLNSEPSHVGCYKPEKLNEDNPMTSTKVANQIKLMVVDDHPAFRMGLVALIQSQPDMTLVAETGDGRDVVELYRREMPHVVLMDLRLPGMSGVEAIIALRREFPECGVIVLTTYDCDEDIFRACQSGAQSYLMKDTSTAE